VTDKQYSDIRAAKPRIQRSRNAEKTLTAVLDAAETLFATQGYDGTTLRQVAEAVYMSQPNLYNYFSSKEKLYEAVLLRAAMPLLSAIHEGVENSKEFDPERADQVIEACMEQLSIRQNLALLIYQESIRGAEILNRISQGVIQSMINESLNGIKQGDNGSWQSAHYPFLVTAWLNLVFGYFASASLMAGTIKGDPLSKKNLALQTDFLKVTWKKLMQD
jgi:AcrR family transcriptional regulator